MGKFEHNYDINIDKDFDSCYDIHKEILCPVRQAEGSVFAEAELWI